MKWFNWLVKGFTSTQVASDEFADRLSDSDLAISRLRLVVDSTFVVPREGLVLGSYRLNSQISVGGFSEVWRAKDTRLPMGEYAIKIFRPNNFTVEHRLEAASRFWRGVNHMRLLEGEQTVVRICEGPCTNIVEGGHYLWFAMELIEGEDLDTSLAKHSLTDNERLAIFDGMIAAIRAAHSKDVRHRDVRPPNVMIRRVDAKTVTPVLIDFDLAYHEGTFAKKYTTQLLWGVDRYLAPDISNAGGDERIRRFRRKSNDLYALCVVLFDMFSGDGVTIPDDRKSRSIARAMPKNSHGHIVTSKARRIVASLCATGLQFAEGQRFKSIEALEAHWYDLRRSSPLARLIFASALAIGSIGILVFLDAHVARLGYLILGLVGWCIPLLAPPIVMYAIGNAPVTPKSQFIRRTAGRLLPATGLLLVAIAITVSAIWKTGFFKRTQTLAVEHGLGCVVIEPSGIRLQLSDSERAISYDSRVLCPEGTAPTRRHRSILPQILGRAFPAPETSSSKAPKPTVSETVVPSPRPDLSIQSKARERTLTNWLSHGTGTYLGTSGKPRPLRAAGVELSEDEVLIGSFRCVLEFNDDGEPNYVRRCRGKSDARTSLPQDSSLVCRMAQDRSKTACWSQKFTFGIGSEQQIGEFRLYLTHSTGPESK